MCGSVLRQSLVKRIRRRRRCYSCERLIPKGTMARCTVGTDCGVATSFYDCLDCIEFDQSEESKQFRDFDGCIGWGAYAEQPYAQYPILEPV